MQDLREMVMKKEHFQSQKNLFQTNRQGLINFQNVEVLMNLILINQVFIKRKELVIQDLRKKKKLQFLFFEKKELVIKDIVLMVRPKANPLKRVI